jgi:ankyrin repeat protein
VAHWLLLKDLHSLTEMQLVHLACMHNAPFNVVRYLSSLFPGSLTTKNKKGYTPFMIALWNKLDEDIIQLLSYSNIDAIGDFDRENDSAKVAIIEHHFGDESLIDSEMTMFCLEHKDPTLNRLVMGDLFHCIHPTESDGLFNSYSSDYERRVMDVLDAVKSHPHLQELILAWDYHDSILWREGNARNALISVLRDLPSTTAISIVTSIPRFRMMGEMMEHCAQLKFLRIDYEGSKISIMICMQAGMGHLLESLNKLPLLESVLFYQVPLYRNRDAILFKRNLMEKNSVRNITMVGTDITNRIASWIVSVLKDNPKCENLEFICLFDCNRPHGSREQWHEDIDLQLEEDAHINHTRKSVSDFMNKINSRETNYNGRSNKELEFITDMLDAKEKDSDDLYDQICRPDHLYALIKARTDYIQRCMDLGTEYTRVANKRHKLNE